MVILIGWNISNILKHELVIIKILNDRETSFTLVSDKENFIILKND